MLRLSVLTMCVCLLSIGAFGARDTPAGTVGLYQQCGGTGGDCGSLKECVDAPWTQKTCSGKLGCKRINVWWWQCEEGPATPVVHTGPIQLDQQCGGMGGECSYYQECKDAAFTKRGCASGLTCTRVNMWHWQCTSNKATPAGSPPPSSPAPPVTGGAISLDQQCGGTGGDCGSLKECRDAPWTQRQCASGLGCKRINVWWWQCAQDRSTSVGHTGPIALDQQCGGKGGECSYYKQCKDAAFTARTCASGLTCKRVNEWHWQCSK